MIFEEITKNSHKNGSNYPILMIFFQSYVFGPKKHDGDLQLYFSWTENPDWAVPSYYATNYLFLAIFGSITQKVITQNISNFHKSCSWVPSWQKTCGVIRDHIQRKLPQKGACPQGKWENLRTPKHQSYFRTVVLKLLCLIIDCSTK